MTKKIRRLLITGVVVAALSSWFAVAQKQDQDTDNQKAGNTVTVTGCLAKGESPNEFHLTADDGKTYDVRSDTAKLTEHVGHKVKVTGTTTKESATEEKEEKGERHEAQQAGNLQVSKLEHVSATCK